MAPLKIRSAGLKLTILLVLLVALTAAGCARRGGAGANPLQSTNAVELITDVPYHDGNPDKHILDIYIPREAKNFPVIFFVHGGAWFAGDKSITAMFGMVMARYGIGVVNVNYRLWPGVRYPGFVKDVARAYAWTVKNIGEYGGDPKTIFVGGHSAGAHLVSLLATNDKFLKKHGLSPDDITGVIAISGVYKLGNEKILKRIFGDRGARDDASPYYHVDVRHTPPFLLFYADNDMEGLSEQARMMADALGKQNVPRRVVKINGRNHNTILGRIGPPDEPATHEILGFIKRYK